LARQSIPTRSFLHQCDYLGFVHGTRRWRSRNGRYLFTWDALHGEVEVFNARGEHRGVMDAVTGRWIKDAVRGRWIDV
jgi:hypothetical protein